MASKYIALRRLTVGHDTIEPGDVVPGTETWPHTAIRAQVSVGGMKEVNTEPSVSSGAVVYIVKNKAELEKVLAYLKNEHPELSVVQAEELSEPEPELEEPTPEQVAAEAAEALTQPEPQVAAEVEVEPEPEVLTCTKCQPTRTFTNPNGLELHNRSKHS